MQPCYVQPLTSLVQAPCKPSQPLPPLTAPAPPPRQSAFQRELFLTFDNGVQEKVPLLQKMQCTV